MQPNHTLTDAGLNIADSVTLIDALGLDALKLQNPTNMRKFREIASFAKGFADGVSVLRRIAAGTPGVDKLDKIWGYVTLRQRILDVKSQIDELPTRDMDDLDREIASEKLKSEFYLLSEEASVYEK